MKMPLRACGVLLVEHDDAGRDAGAVEEVGGQADDALDVAARGRACWRIVASALPRNSTPCGRMHAPLPVLLSEREDVQQEGVVAVLLPAARRTRSGRYVVRGSRPVLHALIENGGLATT